MKETRAFCCLLYFTIVLKVAAYTTVQPSISSADCANLSNKVYCFPRCFINASCYDDIYVFDISKNFGKPLSNLANIWEAIKPASNGISFGKRNDPQTIALPDGKSFFVQGGYDAKTSGSINKTIVYNAETNAWSARPNYYEGPNGGDRQIFSATGTYVGHLNSIVFYGGSQQHVQNGTDYILADGTRIPDVTFTNINDEIVSTVGFYYLTMFNINTNSWSVITQNRPILHFSSQTSIFVPFNNKILYFGGQYRNTSDNDLVYVNMKSTPTYDTVYGLWSIVDSAGSLYPSQRIWHTTTLLHDEYTILLYGGVYQENSDQPEIASDYCYTYNAKTNIWARQTFNASVSTSLQRYLHSAVFIDNSTLGIFFGMDGTSSTKDLLLLDVRDVNRISIADTYPLRNTPKASGINTTQPDSSGPSKSTGISIGVGISCGVAVLMAAIFFYIYRRRKQKSNNQTIQASNQTDPHDQAQMLEVDWDRIDQQYCSQSNSLHQPIQTTTQPQVVAQAPDERLLPEHSNPPTVYLKLLPNNSEQNKASKPAVLCTKPDLADE